MRKIDTAPLYLLTWTGLYAFSILIAQKDETFVRAGREIVRAYNQNVGGGDTTFFLIDLWEYHVHSYIIWGFILVFLSFFVLAKSIKRGGRSAIIPMLPVSILLLVYIIFEISLFFSFATWFFSENLDIIWTGILAFICSFYLNSSEFIYYGVVKAIYWLFWGCLGLYYCIYLARILTGTIKKNR